MTTQEQAIRVTAQEVFDQVVTHLRQQGEKAGTSPTTCFYRFKKEDGTVLKCAAGCLISDEEYDPSFEDNSIRHLINAAWIQESHPLHAFAQKYKEHSSLIMVLQRGHDRLPVEQWEEEFSRIAYARGLTYTPPGA